MSEQSSPRISLPNPLRNIKKYKEFSSAPASPSFLPQQETTVEDANDGPIALVIKSIPFSLKKDDFYYLMNINDIPTPYALNYHFDNGVFRGLAFANYRTSQEASAAINGLHRLELGGRRLRVELKKPVSYGQSSRDMDHNNDRHNQQRPSRHRQGYSGSDNRMAELYELLNEFCDDPTRDVFIPHTRSGKDRKDVHMMAEKFGLHHQSVGVFPDRHVQVRKMPTDSEFNGLADYTSSLEHSEFTSKRESSMSRRPIIQGSSTTRQDTITSPIRQPRGPDLTKNFDTRKDLEQLSLADIVVTHRMSSLVV
ncbi:hypothetical protein BC941DRAFT_413044 [Chlamydoabsidia padenii]|nr:hypothetical protein BC941DRAFT_413044 [Chlamydoabsidia padenii]